MEDARHDQTLLPADFVREKPGGEETKYPRWLTGTDCKSLPNMTISSSDATANRLYNVKCVLLIGQTYELKCESLKLGGWRGGWKSNYLIIENSIYCRATGLEKTVNITITGKVRDVKTLQILFELLEIYDSRNEVSIKGK